MRDEEYNLVHFLTQFPHNFKFDPCINFDLEFLELLKSAIVVFVRIWKNIHSIRKKCLNTLFYAFHEVLRRPLNTILSFLIPGHQKFKKCKIYLFCPN